MFLLRYTTGPFVGESIVCLADVNRPAGTGVPFDARRLRDGVHQLAIRVTDSAGVATLQHLVCTTGRQGRRVRLRSGY
jgi:hypothetical protein